MRQTNPSFQASLFPSLVSTFVVAFLAGSTLKLAHDIMVFIPPIILKLLIRHVASSDPLWKGAGFCFVLVFASSLQTVLMSQYFYKMYLIGLKIKSSLIMAVYRKALRLSSGAKSESSTGEIVNLMSVDVQRVVDMMPYVNMIWR